MLNRRILRTKAFKAVYAFAENHGMTLKEAEGLLELSCESTRDLYLFLLSITGPLTAECRARLEAARGKFNPTEDELNPNMKFAENSIAPLLMDDPDFARIISRKKLSWEPYDMLLRHLYEVETLRHQMSEILTARYSHIGLAATCRIRLCPFSKFTYYFCVLLLHSCVVKFPARRQTAKFKSFPAQYLHYFPYIFYTS